MPVLDDPKQEKFVQELVKGKDQGQAYLDAGYKCKSSAVASACANRLLKNAKVQQRFNELLEAVTEKATSKAAISKAWVIAKLVENVERAMQAEPVRRKAGDNEEEVPGEYVYNGSVANKALEVIGKEIGMFIDRKEIGEPGDFSRMSDEEPEACLAQPIESVLNTANGRSKH